MADAAAVDALKAGESAWSAFRAAAIGAIDLRTADLSGLDLSGRDLSRCRLDGITADHALLSGVDFCDSSLDHASFKDAICTSTRWRVQEANGVIFNGTDLTGASLRASWTSSNFDNAILERATIEESEFLECEMSGSRVTDAKLRDVTVRGGPMGWTGEQLNWQRGAVVGADLSAISLRGATLADVDLAELGSGDGCFEASIFLHCQFSGPISGRIPVRDGQLIGCALHRVNLAGGPFLKSTLDDCLISGCTWPNQRGEVKSLGRYEPAPELLSSPVQDLRGIPPVLRRTIADAQFLVERKESARGLDKVWFRFWGLTTGYGTSFTRLLVVLLLMAIALALTAGTALGFHDNRVPGPCEFAKALLAVLSTASTVGSRTIDHDAGTVGTAVGYAAKFTGVLALGVFGGLVANRVGRLSSQ